MHMKPRRSRSRILAIGALVGSVLSVGVAASDVSAGGNSSKDDKVNVVKQVDEPIYTSSLRSGIRW